jgi:hypothetical protein
LEFFATRRLKRQGIELTMVGRDGIAGTAAAFGDVPLPGSASVLDVATIRAIADRSNAFRILLARHEQALIAQARQSAACNASHSVEARWSHWLLRARDLRDSERRR